MHPSEHHWCSRARSALTEGHDQAEVIDFLSDPASRQTGAFDRFETHGALVFLAGEEAWKIRRAVRFPYMDFSTLEKRRIASTHELEINQRMAPEIYIGVVAITRENDGRLQIGGSGEIVEWAVRMRRFDQSALLRHLVDSGSISTDLAIGLPTRYLKATRPRCPGPATPARRGSNQAGQHNVEHCTRCRASDATPEIVRRQLGWHLDLIRNLKPSRCFRQA